jgi:hypothetical protein
MSETQIAAPQVSKERFVKRGSLEEYAWMDNNKKQTIPAAIPLGVLAAQRAKENMSSKDNLLAKIYMRPASA